MERARVSQSYMEKEESSEITKRKEIQHIIFLNEIPHIFFRFKLIEPSDYWLLQLSLAENIVFKKTGTTCFCITEPLRVLVAWGLLELSLKFLQHLMGAVINRFNLIQKFLFFQPSTPFFCILDIIMKNKINIYTYPSRLFLFFIWTLSTLLHHSSMQKVPYYISSNV